MNKHSNLSQIDKDPDLIRWTEEFGQAKKELLKIGPFRKGSVFQHWNVCGNPKCRCKKALEFRHGPYYAWTKKEQAKTVTLKVPADMLPEAKHYVANAKQLEKIIKTMAQISDKIIRRKIEIIRQASSKKTQN